MAADDEVDVTVALTGDNYRKLESTAAITGDDRTDTINRAIAMYEEMMTARPGARIKWADRDGTEHMALVFR